MDLGLLKKELFQRCIQYVEHRIENAQSALNSAIDAANSEEKSSVGDKYETARAMAQLEQEKANHQLDEANKLKVMLLKINPDVSLSKAGTGSMVLTNKSNFFIAISAGKMVIDERDFFIIAPATPIGKQINGLRVGDSFTFNNQTHIINEIL